MFSEFVILTERVSGRTHYLLQIVTDLSIAAIDIATLKQNNCTTVAVSAELTICQQWVLHDVRAMF